MDWKALRATIDEFEQRFGLDARPIVSDIIWRWAMWGKGWSWTQGKQ